MPIHAPKLWSKQVGGLVNTYYSYVLVKSYEVPVQLFHE